MLSEASCEALFRTGGIAFGGFSGRRMMPDPIQIAGDAVIDVLITGGVGPGAVNIVLVAGGSC